MRKTRVLTLNSLESRREIRIIEAVFINHCGKFNDTIFTLKDMGSQKGPQGRDCRCAVVLLNKCPDFHAARILFPVSHKIADSLGQGLSLTFIQAPLPPHLAPGPGSELE